MCLKCIIIGLSYVTPATVFPQGLRQVSHDLAQDKRDAWRHSRRYLHHISTSVHWILSKVAFLQQRDSMPFYVTSSDLGTCPSALSPQSHWPAMSPFHSSHRLKRYASSWERNVHLATHYTSDQLPIVPHPLLIHTVAIIHSDSQPVAHQSPQANIVTIRGPSKGTQSTLWVDSALSSWPTIQRHISHKLHQFRSAGPARGVISHRPCDASPVRQIFSHRGDFFEWGATTSGCGATARRASPACPSCSHTINLRRDPSTGTLVLLECLHLFAPTGETSYPWAIQFQFADSSLQVV